MTSYERARRRVIISLCATVGAIVVGVVWGEAFGGDAVPVALVIPALGLGIPLTIVFWMDLAKAPRPASMRGSRVGRWLAAQGIRFIGVLAILTGLTMVVGHAVATFKPPTSGPLPGSR